MNNNKSFFDAWDNTFNTPQPIDPEVPKYPYAGTLNSENSYLPVGYELEFSNAKLYPLFDGYSNKVTLDFGNGTVIFYPNGKIEYKLEPEFLNLRILFNGVVISFKTA